MRIPFGSHSYEHRSTPVSAQRLINFYPELQPSTAKDQFIIHGTPGLAKLVEVGSGPIHGMKEMNGVLYVVSGEELYSVTSIFTVTLIGTIAGNSRVSLDHNGTQLLITNGSKGYVYSVSGGLSEITDTDFKQSYSVVYLDSYFFLAEKGSKNMFSSRILDGTTYNGLDFTSADGLPDNIVTLATNHRDLIVFCEKSIEIWYNAANSVGFPFSRINGGLITKGCRARYSVQNIDGIMLWLGDDNSVYMLDGYTSPRPISDPSIEYAMQKSNNLSAAYSYTYTEESHKFYCLTIPDLEQTWCFDLTTGRWHQRSYRVTPTNNMIRHRANCYEYAFGKHIVGDYHNNKIYEMSLDVYRDDGEEIHREATSPPIHNSRKKMIMDWLQIDIESGAGLVTGQGSDPKLFLQVSKDGGRTWYFKDDESAGKIGEYIHRSTWRNFGAFYDVILKMSISDPIKIVAINAEAKVELEQW